MSKRKAFWLSGVIVTFVLFYFLIPNSIYNLSPVVISMIGAVLMTFFLIQSIGDFKSYKEFNTPDPDEKTVAHRIVPWMVVPGIVLVFVFSLNFSSKEKRGANAQELAREGRGTAQLDLTDALQTFSVRLTDCPSRLLRCLLFYQ